MERHRLLRLLREYRAGRVTAAQVVAALSGARAEELAAGIVDHGRLHRHGVPEVIYGEGKTPAEAAELAEAIWRGAGWLLVTRADPEHFEAVQERVPQARYEPRARVIYSRRGRRRPRGLVAVVAAGTADVPVAEEARLTAAMLDARVQTFYDVGVAGLHRLLDRLAALRRARALVVVAGMEGALPSVVGGLVAAPVVAVPTSVGYGVGTGGVAALLGMLTSCAPNVCVVNIDNGFGAGYVAALINRGPGRGAGA